MIETIKEKLEELGENVQIGICKKKDTWDCLLVRKKRIEKSGTSGVDYSHYVSVRVIKENEITEEMVFDVIEKMKELGYKHAKEPIVYEYTIDVNDIVVEICEILFVKARKA